jgi:hypothetical protein
MNSTSLNSGLPRKTTTLLMAAVASVSMTGFAVANASQQPQQTTMQTTTPQAETLPTTFNEYTARWFDGLAVLSQRNDTDPHANLTIDPIDNITKMCPNTRNLRKLNEAVHTLYDCVCPVENPEAASSADAKIVMHLLCHVVELQAGKFKSEFKRQVSHVASEASAASEMMNLIRQSINNGKGRRTALA